jgi:hypothetical protein
MIHILAAPCNGSGTWTQQWNCGWHQPTTTAANAGATFGHGAAAGLIALIVIVVLIALARRGRRPVAAR